MGMSMSNKNIPKTYLPTYLCDSSDSCETSDSSDSSACSDSSGSSDSSEQKAFFFLHQKTVFAKRCSLKNFFPQKLFSPKISKFD